MARAASFQLPSCPPLAQVAQTQQGMVEATRACALCSISKVSFYNASEYDEAGSLATIRRALDLGITMLDTAEVYGGEEHENETWIGVRRFAACSLRSEASKQAM